MAKNNPNNQSPRKGKSAMTDEAKKRLFGQGSEKSPSTAKSDEYSDVINSEMADHDPLSPPVIQRPYTTDGLGSGDLPYDPDFNRIPVPPADNPNKGFDPDEGFGGDDIPDGDGDWHEAGGDTHSDDDRQNNLSDMSSSQKRKAAEKTADALLETYCNFAPMPFKHFSSFNIPKAEQAEIRGELDLGMQIAEDGTTVRQHMEGTNRQVEEIFTVSDDTRQNIKEPLVDVLLETNFALTPTQRLLLAVGTHVATMTIHTIQLVGANRNAMEQFKAFHAENKAIANARTVHFGSQEMNGQPQREQSQQQEYTEKEVSDAKAYMESDEQTTEFEVTG